MKFKSGDIVYWKSSGHTCGYVPDENGNPKEFVVLGPGYKYCTLRSREFLEKGYSFQDLENFDMSKLFYVRSSLSTEDHSSLRTET